MNNPTRGILQILIPQLIDIQWRKKVKRHLKPFQPKEILDVATGTGDLAIELNKLNPDRIIGIDIAIEMLTVGNEKLSKKKIDLRRCIWLRS